VDDTAQVRVGEGVGRLAEEPAHLVDRPTRLMLEELGDVAPSHERHDEVRDAVPLADVVDRHDVGMGELGGRLRLAGESDAERRVVGQLRGKDLDRHEALEPEVAGPVHDGHPAAPDLVLDPVLVAQRVGDAVAQGVGLEVGHVGDTGWPGSSFL
jgi:hypothetical protein